MAVRNTIPTAQEKKFDYIILTTKSIPDIPPPLPDLIAPAILPSHTAIILIQNGVNVEHPFQEQFPTNPIISGVSFTSATEVELGLIRHDDHDRVRLGPFPYPRNQDSGGGELSVKATTATRTFITAYNPQRQHQHQQLHHRRPIRHRRPRNPLAETHLQCLFQPRLRDTADGCHPDASIRACH